MGRHGGSAADAVANCEQSPSLAWLGDDCNALHAKHGINGDYIVLVPGCSKKHLHKRWPHHSELARTLTEVGYTVLMAPGPDEMSLQRPVIKMLHEDGGHLDIFALTGLLQGAKLVVGNDTGPVHIAAASGIPTIMVMQQAPTATFAGLHRDNMKLMYKDGGGTLATEVVAAAVMDALQTN
ncbi:MAG: glycosyltransferase family 9 protein [Candidatus Porifericomitaceae bacterium WSBS_2022_MAG_OTU9]